MKIIELLRPNIQCLIQKADVQNVISIFLIKNLKCRKHIDIIMTRPSSAWTVLFLSRYVFPELSNRLLKELLLLKLLTLIQKLYLYNCYKLDSISLILFLKCLGWNNKIISSRYPKLTSELKKAKIHIQCWWSETTHY